jgi:hypothetical protein
MSVATNKIIGSKAIMDSHNFIFNNTTIATLEMYCELHF